MAQAKDAPLPRADYGTVPRSDGGESVPLTTSSRVKRLRTNKVLFAYPAFLLIAVLLLLISSAGLMKQQVERWGIFELAMTGPPDDGEFNPFEVEFNATFFQCASESLIKRSRDRAQCQHPRYTD
jgi:hypothetical protein